MFSIFSISPFHTEKFSALYLQAVFLVDSVSVYVSVSKSVSISVTGSVSVSVILKTSVLLLRSWISLGTCSESVAPSFLSSLVSTISDWLDESKL